MFQLKACKVCFSTNKKLYSMDVFSIRNEFNAISGLRSSKKDKYPDYLCSICYCYVRNYMKFRDKCQRAHYALEELLRQNKKVDIKTLNSFDRNIIGNMPSLSYLGKNKAHYEEAKFQWIKTNRASVVEKLDITILHYGTLKNHIFELPLVNQNETKVKEESIFNGNIPEDMDGQKMLEDLVAKTSCSDYFGDGGISDNDVFEDDTETKINTENVDGSQLDEEYADMVPITLAEAKAVMDVYKACSKGKAQCSVCQKSYVKENRLEVHLRMHDKLVSGNYYCELCQYYYKSDYLLKTHMADKHMYKYLCRKCPEVSFDRSSAKQHFIWVHLQKGDKKNSNWYDTRPTWLSKRGGKRIKGKCKNNVVSLRPVRKIIKLPEDFLKYSPISQTEQYQMVLDRKKSRNYLEAKFRCELCYKGFRETVTYVKHMKKHDPAISGPLQCDMCKLQFWSPRNIYKHMIITHLFKYTCQWCSFVCCNRGQAHMHYRFHKNVTYQCPHCPREFKKASTRLTHIRIKHPSTNICRICGHSFVSETGLYCHKKIAHSKEEIETSDAAPIDKQDALYCEPCDIHFQNNAAFKTHLGSSSKHTSTNLSITPKGGNKPRRGRAGRPARVGNAADDIVNNGLPTSTHCEICQKFLPNDVQARKHYEAEHPGTEYLKRYMCDVCGHTTKQYANLMVHMRTHTNEKPYKCPHCDRSFSMPSNRDRHIVVHTGEKRYQCEHCNRRFTQSSAVKLHIQTVHLKIPYPPWDKKNRKRRKELEGTSAPVSAVTPAVCIQPQPKIIIESQDYLNAYITYNDDIV